MAHCERRTGRLNLPSGGLGETFAEGEIKALHPHGGQIGGDGVSSLQMEGQNRQDKVVVSSHDWTGVPRSRVKESQGE